MLGRAIKRALEPSPFMGSGSSATGWNDQTGYFGADATRVLADAGTYTYPNPVTHPGNYSSHLDGGGAESGVMALSAGWRCLHILADGIGALDIHAVARDDGGTRVDTPRVLSDPWPSITPVEWRAMAVASLLLYGNLYFLPTDPDPRTGYPRQLPIMHPNKMRVKLVDGKVVYQHSDFGEMDSYEVLHIRGYTPPGHHLGIGIIEAQRRSVGNATAIDEYQRSNILNSAVPPAIIKVNRPEISTEQAEDIQNRWVTRHGGPNRRPAVISTALDVETIAWSPEDTQFLESKQFSSVEVCWMFGIDPRLLGLSASGQSVTYVNVETAYVDLQRMSFLPWTSRLESGLSRVLPRNQNARFDFEPMLRTTLRDRYESYKLGLEGGWLTLPEVRAKERAGPLDKPVPDAGVVEPDKDVNESLTPDRNAAPLQSVV